LSLPLAGCLYLGRRTADAVRVWRARRPRSGAAQAVLAFAAFGLLLLPACTLGRTEQADDGVVGLGSTPALGATVADVAYGPDPAQRLDVHLPRSPAAALRPAVIFFHGGGWTVGDRSQLSPLATDQLSDGWVVVSVDYRLAPQHPYPAAVQDAKRAVRWLRANADRYGIDPERLVAWGHSAGGHLAAMVGLTAGDTGFTDPDLPADLLSVTDGVAGWVSMAGISDLDAWRRSPHEWAAPFTGSFLGCDASLASDEAGACDPEDLAAASPLTHVDPSDAPGYVLHGLTDAVVPVDQAVRLHAALAAAGTDSVLDVVDTGGSAVTDHVPDGGVDREALAQWLDRCCAG
jgi:acetyl esterase/lipase